VLVVDDNRDITSTMGMVLEIEGYEFALAHDGIEALAVAETFRPEAAFVDIGMPRMDGYQVAARLRGTDWGREMLLVATTGWGQQEDKQRALGRGLRPAPHQAGVAGRARQPARGADGGARTVTRGASSTSAGTSRPSASSRAPFGEYTRTLTPRTSCVLCVVVTYIT
jgi:CheY-like chemotaxis protein